MSTFDYKAAIQKIPHKPGVYQFFDADHNLIYIGKAKDLRNRVSSYFINDKLNENAKTKVLVRKIQEIAFTLVDTELDAWLLENSLIKKHQPKYNVLLKDDKTYPSICIKNERFPRIFPTRTIVKDGSQYFGPYASVRIMNTMLDLIRSLYPIRTCNLHLAQEHIDRNKYKVCLEYQLGNCKGPCQAYQTEEEYMKNIREIKEILKGNIGPVLNHLHKEMEQAASNLDFELAQKLKARYETLENYQSKSTVVNPSLDNIDVFSIASEENSAFVNYLKVIRGTIAQTQTIELKKKLDETDAELLSIAISEFRNKFESTSKEILVPFDLKIDDRRVRFAVPRIGDKKKLLDLSTKNAHFFKNSKLEQYEKLNPELRTQRILTQLMKDLRLNVLPDHIECFDNSNIQGKYPVSALVVFRDAKPSKKEYRHYNMRTVEGPNDFATMEEVVYRRYRRLLDEQQELPKLIVIDGGRGQLSSAMKSLQRLGVEKEMAVIGIAKKLEEIYYYNDPIPVYLDKKSESLKVLQHLRNEAHRFGITFHRNKRQKQTIRTELEGIEGIGQTTAARLLREFKSVKKIRESTLEDLQKILDRRKAENVFRYFHP
jgi:excinuclease ABC subunit C